MSSFIFLTLYYKRKGLNFKSKYIKSTFLISLSLIIYMSNLVGHQSTIVFHSRQRQLQKENSMLKHQLKSSRHMIQKLQQEIQELKRQIKNLNIENSRLREQRKQEIILGRSNVSGSKIRRSPLSKSSLKLTKDFNQQLQVFTSSSDSDMQQHEAFESISSLIHPLGKSSKNIYFEQSSIILGKRNDKEEPNQFSEIKLNQKKGNDTLKKKSNQRSLKKTDSTKLFRPVSYFDIDPNQDNATFSTIHVQSVVKQSPLSSNLTRSQKLIPNQHSVINTIILPNLFKTQGLIRSPQQQQKVFKKVSIGKPIYDVFFVTGLGNKATPQVIYSYPKQGCEHFGAILAMCYSDQFLKLKQSNSIVTSSSSSKNLMNVTNPQSHHSKLKQFYIIPLHKSDFSNEKQYLTVCQVQEVILIPKENSLIPCVFQRMYCFISGSQFFVSFKNLINQFIDKINTQKAKYSMQTLYFTQQQYKQIIVESLQHPLSILSQKSAESNHTLNYRLDQYISIAIDIPSLENSYKLVTQYRPWGVMNFKLQLKSNDDHINPLETKLFGVLIVYALSEKKVVLFSTSKSKVSQAILHLLQIIKPLQYVCPVIMTVLRQQHEEYFSAPMSLLLGLWTEQKKLQKQKIQIFMNRKQNLAGMIEKGKMHIQDGIVINLDTGLVYGDGLVEVLTSTAILVNQYYESYCHHLKDVFKLFDRLFSIKNGVREDTQLMQIKRKIDQVIKGTQLAMYHLQKSARKP